MANVRYDIYKYELFLCHTNPLPCTLLSKTEVNIRRGIQLYSPQYLSYYQTKPHDVATHKNCLIETHPFSTHNIVLQ